MQLIHTLGQHIELEHNGVQLLRYVYNSQTPAIESPRPYFHPLRTLKGHVVSGFRPHDHRWHHGLSFTCAHLSGHNFWGGPTFQDGEYRQLENNGRQILLTHHSELNFLYRWETQSSETIVSEVRHQEAFVKEDFWFLDISSVIYLGTSMQDKSGQEPVVWGSPTTQGRDSAGYGGLFWRGPREFLGGKVLMSEGRVGPDLMGQKSPWLAYIGAHDESDDFSTLVFLDGPENPRYPTQWFVRNTTPMVCPNFFFEEEYVQQPGEILSLNYKILIADGAWSREKIEAEVEKLI